MRGHGDQEAAEQSELARRFAASEQRSRRRRRVRRLGRVSPLRVLVAVPLLVVLGSLVAGSLDVAGERPEAGHQLVEGVTLRGAVASADAVGTSRRRPARPTVPTAAALRRAWAYAQRRSGLVSIGVVDTEGRLRGRAGTVRFVSASVAGVAKRLLGN